MILTDLLYYVFLALTAILYAVAGSKRKWVLITAGVLFYAYYAGQFIILLLVETLAIYALTRDPTQKWKLAFVLSLGVLVLYKYAGFIYSNLSGILLFSASNPFLLISIPLAISFFTFEFLHYIIERASGKIPPSPLSNFLAFAFFFPSLIAGPIKRFNEFNDQVENFVPAGSYDVLIGSFRVMVGLFKKLVLADSFAYIASGVNNSKYVAAATPELMWIVMIAYTLRIYFDFSGYSDIAIGSARLFGIKLPENFDYPLLSRNIAEFWKRWHMSLYSWLSDYVFKPLSISLREYKLWGIITSILVVFALSGLWHGSNWNFVAWGMAHGLGVAGYMFYRAKLKPLVSQEKWYRTNYFTALAIVLNFLFVTFTFSLFAVPLPTAVYVMQKLLFLA